MAIDRVPILKRCRSLGLDPIYLGIGKKPNREPKRTNKKLNEYGIQLREKQKAKPTYGASGKFLRNHYARVSRMNDIVGTNLTILLECRLDNAPSRMGPGCTHRETRQIINHRHILANGKSVNIPSYHIKAGDVIEVRERYKPVQRYKDILEVTGGCTVPVWLNVDQKNLRGAVKEVPTRDEIDAPINEMLIVELYSK